MDKSQIPNELKSLTPFFHDIDLGNGYNTNPETYRMSNCIDLFFPPMLKLSGGNLKGLRILDVGCNCGGFSFAAAKYGAKEVIGIDSDQKNVDQATAIRKYLKVSNVEFKKITIEELNEKTFGKFDVCILAGILYHLESPISVMKIISKITKSTIMVDCHVHYSSNTAEEDIPSWWMLSDTDRKDLEGLFDNNPILSPEKYLKFEKETEIDYSKLPNQFTPSPYTNRDLKFVQQCIPYPTQEMAREYNIGSADPESLVFVPNKKAIYKLIRYFGFEDILEITPHRFSEIPYLMRYRIGFFAIRRDKNGPFNISILQNHNA